MRYSLLFLVLSISNLITVAQSSILINLQSDTETEVLSSYSSLDDFKLESAIAQVGNIQIKIVFIDFESKDDYLALIPYDLDTFYFNYSASKKPINKVKWLYIDSVVYEVRAVEGRLELLRSEKSIIDTVSTLFYLDYRRMPLELLRFSDKSNKLINYVNGYSTTVFYFWASWCQPCVQNLPSLIQMAAENSDYMIFIISYDGKIKELQSFVSNLSVSENIQLIKGSTHFSQLLQVNGLPYIMLYKENYLKAESIRNLETLKKIMDFN